MGGVRFIKGSRLKEEQYSDMYLQECVPRTYSPGTTHELATIARTLYECQAKGKHTGRRRHWYWHFAS